MDRRSFLTTGTSAFAWTALAKQAHAQMFRGQVPDGPFQPDWESLKSYRCPSGIATQSSAYGRIGARSAFRRTATGTRAICTSREHPNMSFM